MSDVQQAAIEAVRYYIEQDKELRKRRILHNTEEILKHYLALTDNLESLEAEGLFIKSFTESRSVTEALMRHINRCLDKLEGEQPSKFDVLAHLYMSQELVSYEWNERIEITAEKMHTSARTVRRWRKEMVEKLSVKIFGAEGIRLWIL